MTQEQIDSLEDGSPKFQYAYKAYKNLWDNLYKFLTTQSCLRFRIPVSEVLQYMDNSFTEKLQVLDNED